MGITGLEVCERCNIWVSEKLSFTLDDLLIVWVWIQVIDMRVFACLFEDLASIVVMVASDCMVLRLEIVMLFNVW